PRFPVVFFLLGLAAALFRNRCVLFRRRSILFLASFLLYFDHVGARRVYGFQHGVAVGGLDAVPIQGQLQVGREGVGLGVRDRHALVGFLHVLAGVFQRTTRRLAYELDDLLFQLS